MYLFFVLMRDITLIMLVCSYAESGFGKVGVYLCGKPLTPENNYFEVEIHDIGLRGDIGNILIKTLC